MNKQIKRIVYLLGIMLCLQSTLQAQKTSFFARADTLDSARFYAALGLGVGSFTATSIGLYNSWYKKFDQSKFHLFNDWQEWEKMDKMGHAYTSYSLCNIGYQGARWTGVSKKGALWFAGIGSTAIQSVIEIMDGYSSKWGFSMGDIGFNFLGSGIFIGQEIIWDQQKIRLKISSSPKSYPTIPIDGINTTYFYDTEQRVDELFGVSRIERFLKDYNAQTVWASFNLSSFMPHTKMPKWLNVSLGYSAENMFGGFQNSFTNDLGNPVTIPLTRYRQYLLSLDIDLNRIQTKNYFLNTVLRTINIFKIPAPTIEYNSLGEWRFHLLFRA